MSRFIELLELAARNGWCVEPECTTCGSMDFRNGLGAMHNELADDLATIDLSKLRRVRGWSNGLRLALDQLDRAPLKDRVLSAWLPQLDNHVRIADIVLFYYVRRGALFAPMSVDVLQEWRAKCIDLASVTLDESLIESLICTLGDHKEWPELEQAVHAVALKSDRVAKALRRSRPSR